MTKSESIKEIAAALAKAQGAIKGAAKDRTNPHFKSQYADLASVWEACRAQLAANGIAVVQGVESEGQTVRVETTLAHSSGEWITSSLTLPVAQVTAQGVGSAITYGRRYGLSAMVGIAPTDDDDGEAASAPMQRPPVSSPAPAPAAANGNPPHVTAAWEMAKRVYGNAKDAAEPWKIAVASIIGHQRDAKSMTQAEALDVEAILKEKVNAPGDSIPF